MIANNELTRSHAPLRHPKRQREADDTDTAATAQSIKRSHKEYKSAQIDIEKGVDLFLARSSPQVMVDYIANQTCLFAPDLSLIERNESRLSGMLTIDNSKLARL